MKKHRTKLKLANPENGNIVLKGINSNDKTLHIIKGGEHVIPCHLTRHEAYPIIEEFIAKITKT